jgi:hypothetical protein
MRGVIARRLIANVKLCRAFAKLIGKPLPHPSSNARENSLSRVMNSVRIARYRFLPKSSHDINAPSEKQISFFCH